MVSGRVPLQYFSGLIHVVIYTSNKNQKSDLLNDEIGNFSLWACQLRRLEPKAAQQKQQKNKPKKKICEWHEDQTRNFPSAVAEKSCTHSASEMLHLSNSVVIRVGAL